MRLLSVWAIVALLAVAVGGSAHAAALIINNGLAPPNPANVLDDATYQDDILFIRDLGCDGLNNLPCASAGTPTAVSLVAGGLIDWLYIQDTSILDMSGGSVANSLVGYQSADLTVSGGSVGQILAARESSTLTMSGGSVMSNLLVRDSASGMLTGGTVAGELRAMGTALLLISGSGFEVDGVPVPYGDLIAESGVLTGTLLSGDPLSNVFRQGEAAGSFTGTIRLVPEPDTALLFSMGLLGLAVARRRASPIGGTEDR